MLLFFPDSWSLLFTIISPHTLHSFDYNNQKFFLIYVWWVSLKKKSNELFAVCLMCYSLLSFKFSNPLSNVYCFSSGCMLLILKLAFVSLGDFYWDYNDSWIIETQYVHFNLQYDHENRVVTLKKSISMYNSCDLFLRIELFMNTTIY